ncbi:MAG: tRNA pseudouridine(38-40) synthase TruA [Bacteroidota bacterium]
MRYFLSIKYHGAAYHGWQIQQNALSVQQILDETLSKVLRQPIATVGSGRTDTGVHAQGQVAHFDCNSPINEAEYLYRFNAALPRDISISELVKVNEKAHARFSATCRSYQYFIHQKKNPFLSGLSCFLPTKVDIEAMNKAAQQLVRYGKQSYVSFSRKNSQNPSHDCHIFRADWHVLEEDRLVFSISADRFLRGMVRAIVGTMLDIGGKKISLADLEVIIKSQDRRRAGPSVDACGLFLTEVTYPTEIYQQ